jgi:hypothetical protein
MEVIGGQAVTSGRLTNRSHRYNRVTTYRPVSHTAMSLRFPLAALTRGESAVGQGVFTTAPLP